MSRLYNRRTFLRTAGLGAMALASGAPSCSSMRIRRASDSALRLVFFSDVHARTDPRIPNALEKAAAAINAQKPDLVIGGGDFIEGGLDSSIDEMEPRWQIYQAMHDAIEADVYPCIGNHDLVGALPSDGSPPAADPRGVFKEKLGMERTHDSFDAAGYHFAILDSINVVGGESKYEGRIGAEQLAWLEEDLAKLHPGTPIVLVTHIPLLTVFDSATDGASRALSANRVIVNNNQVLGLLRRHRVVLVLQGHLHVKELIEFRGTTFLTGGAICAKWWRGPWHDTPEGFCVVSLSNQGVAWEYMGYGWTAAGAAEASG